MSSEFESFYPPKPFLEKETPKPGHLAVTLFSLVLFIITFLIFFQDKAVLLVQLLAVIIVHEAGHFLMMKKFGYENVRMLFIPLLGAFVHGSKSEYRQKESVWVILAGPVPGIIIGAILGYIGLEMGVKWMVQVAFISFILNVINLFPLLPLDGGRLLNVLFFERIELFHLIFAFVSSLVIIAVGYFLDAYILVVFGFLMGFQVRGMHRKYLIHKSLRDSNVEYHTSYDKLTNRAYHFIRKEMLEHTPGLKRFVEESGDDAEELSNMVAGEVNNMLVPPQHKDAGPVFRVMVVIVWLLSMVGPVFQMLQSGFIQMVND